MVSAPPVDATGEHATVLDYLLTRHDDNDDGVIERAEYDRDEESWSLADIQAERRAAFDRDVARRLREKGPWPALVSGVDTDGDEVVTAREGVRLAGKIAPDFALEPLHGGESVRLSSFVGDRPVALIFGSYT